MKIKQRYQVGDAIGQYHVLSYLGWFRQSPVTQRICRDEHHWYKVLCSCGKQEIRSQQQLRDTRRIQACPDCRAKMDPEDKFEMDDEEAKKATEAWLSGGELNWKQPVGHRY